MKGFIAAILLLASQAMGQFITLGNNGQASVLLPTVVSTSQCGIYNGTATCPVTTVSGHLLVAFTGTVDTTSTTPTPSGCVTWTQQGTTDAYGDAMWTGPETSSGSCSVTSTNAVGNLVLVWDAANTAGTLDGTPTFSHNTESSYPVNGAPITTSVSGDLILAACIASGSFPTAESPFTSDFSGAVGPWGGGQQHYLQPAAGAITPTWGGTGSSIVYYCGTMAVKP